MSYVAITLYELASTHYADLLREAAEESLGEQATFGRGARSRRLRDNLKTISAALRHRQRVTATRIRRQFWTFPA